MDTMDEGKLSGKEFENLIESLKTGFLKLLADIESFNETHDDEISLENQEQLDELSKLLLDISQKISRINYDMLDELYGRSISLYYQIKEAAINGDKNAIQTLTVIKPLFEKSLKENLQLHLN